MPYADPDTRRLYHRRYMRNYIKTLTPAQIESKREARQRWADKNPDHQRLYYAKNKHAFRARNLKKLYGITAADYAALLATQRGSCAICGTTSPGQKRTQFAVDHCHKTGRVRGLLCSPCNARLGTLEVWHVQHEATIRAYLAK